MCYIVILKLTSFEPLDIGIAQVCVGAILPSFNLVFLENAQLCAIEIFYVYSAQLGLQNGYFAFLGLVRTFFLCKRVHFFVFIWPTVARQ